MNSKMPGLAGHFYARNTSNKPPLHAPTIKDRQSSAHHLLSRPGNNEQQALGKTLVGTILGMARLAVLAGALALTGCVTTENSLSANDIANMKLAGVTVSYAPDALVIWDDGIRAYAASKGIVEDMATATNTPEGKAYVRNMLASRVKGDVEQQMAGQLNGMRPVRLDVVVHSFTIASAVQRIVIGGGHGMTADANLVDARTGAVILSHPKLTAAVAAAGGVLGTAVQAAVEAAAKIDNTDTVANRWGATYRDWLLRRA